MKYKAFAALYDAVAACIQSDGRRLQRALKSAPAQNIFAYAVRHKCGGLLLHGIAALRIRDAELAELTGLLRRYAAAAALDAQSLREQIAQVLDALQSRAIPHALLKGSARLCGGDAITEWTHVFDIDVFVPLEAAEDAARALLDQGYRYQYEEPTVAGYRKYHQHLAPMLPPGAGKPVELHVALMPPSRFSLRCDWYALQAHFEVIEASGGTPRLDAFGRALHMAMHGAGLYRLGDAAQIALELRSRPDLYEELTACAREEKIQPVPLFAVLAAGAHLAGLQAQAPFTVRRYLEWSIAREDLPKFCRGRMQLADAWFANGGAWSGPATQLAFPPSKRYDGTSTSLLERSRTLGGRIAAGIAGSILARTATRRTVLQPR